MRKALVSGAFLFRIPLRCCPAECSLCGWEESSDPLSGLFLIRLAAINFDCLQPDGFKILLEILTRFPALSVSEIPIRFEHRNAGESKASLYEVWRFLRLLICLRTTGDQHFLQFVAVGASGLLINSAVLAFATEWLHIYYQYFTKGLEHG